MEESKRIHSTLEAELEECQIHLIEGLNIFTNQKRDIWYVFDGHRTLLFETQQEVIEHLNQRLSENTGKGD